MSSIAKRLILGQGPQFQISWNNALSQSISVSMPTNAPPQARPRIEFAFSPAGNLDIIRVTTQGTNSPGTWAQGINPMTPNILMRATFEGLQGTVRSGNFGIKLPMEAPWNFSFAGSTVPFEVLSGQVTFDFFLATFPDTVVYSKTLVLSLARN